jgi:hypothetical protein
MEIRQRLVKNARYGCRYGRVSELVAKPVASNLSTAGWGKERCCKREWESGRFRAVAERTADCRAYSQRKSFHSVANRQDASTLGPFSRSKRKFRLLCAAHDQKRQIVRLLQTLPKARQVLETTGDQPIRRYPYVLRRQRANSVETILLARAIPCFRQPVGIK